MDAISEHCVSDADFLSRWGKLGEPVKNSRFVRDKCLVCDEPIRVARQDFGKPNCCSGCQPCYRGRPGMSTYEAYQTLQYIYEQILDGEN